MGGGRVKWEVVEKGREKVECNEEMEANKAFKGERLGRRKEGGRGLSRGR